jgi:hypothetical protein
MKQYPFWNKLSESIHLQQGLSDSMPSRKHSCTVLLRDEYRGADTAPAEELFGLGSQERFSEGGSVRPRLVWNLMKGQRPLCLEQTIHQAGVLPISFGKKSQTMQVNNDSAEDSLL